MSGEAFLEALPLVRSNGNASHFQIGGVTVGAGATPIVIAGPCAVESAAQILQIAEYVKKCGAHGLRGGVFKPRSSPYSFQGLGQSGLEYLTVAREKTGLFIVIEVTGIEQIGQVTDYADVLQIGARNMQNFELLKAVGRSSKPVLLKRGLSATVQELLQAAEYILNEGNSQVMLCERGIRTFETITRNTLDINAIPLLKQLTHLPVLVDPSHGTGRRDLVKPVAKAAISAGADGLIIEVHPEPNIALSDGHQSLDFVQFRELMNELSVNKSYHYNTSFNALPTLPQFTELAASGKYNYIPVYGDLIVDTETPVTAFLKLTHGHQRFLLESVDRGEQVGRYSFIGWDPLVTIKAFGNQIEISDESGVKQVEGDPLHLMQQIIADFKVAPLSQLGKFYGGAVGFIGYDYVRQIENLPDCHPAELGLPDFHWIIPRYLTCFDHVKHQITNIVLAKADPTHAETVYQDAVVQLETVFGTLNQQLHLSPLQSSSQAKSNRERNFSLSQTEYMERVERIKEYITAGDAFQVVLSQRINQSYIGDPFEFYRLLRTINPSPYLFYLDFGPYQMAGSSPEVMVRLEGDIVTLKPIAGTRPRGSSVLEDERLKRELLNDQKERAEHVMLVDLGRNDVGRVCKFGTVNVTELMEVENYSHVMHIVSTIRGELMPELSGVDLMRAAFPAGTLSGAPKIRAMEIIDQLEPVRREFYGGSVGYFGFNGNIDTCITIRTVLFTQGKATLQVGAGIVADSIPETEYQETMNKAGALLAALDRVGEVEVC